MININDLLSYTYNEIIDKNDVNNLIKNWTIVLEQLPEERRKKILENKEFDPLNALKKINKNKTSINSIKYQFSKSSKTYGRLFAKSASLQSLPREFRSFLARKNYYDIDFVNCHPNLLEQYCLKKGIKCDNLSYYNANREEVFKSLINDLNYDKNDCKNLILTLLNGGDKEGLTSTNNILKNFKNEMDTIHNLIVQLNPKIFKQVKKTYGDKEHNLNGKLVNRILCDLENEVMLTAVRYLIDKNYNVDCFIFDGFLIRIEENKIVDAYLLNEVSNFVLENTGYNLKLIQKEFDNIINLENIEINEEQNDLSKDATYYKDKEEFEKIHFKIQFPPSYATIDGTNEIYIQQTEGFHNSYSHKITKVLTKVGDKECLVDALFTKKWIHDPNIRVYKKADFYPNKSKCPIDVYNLFKGFKAEEYEPINDKNKIDELVEPIINQFKVIAQEHYKFLIIFYAYIIQYPDYKTNINIVVVGKEGTGKSFLNDFFRNKILGEELSSQTDDTDDLFSRFSNIYVKKLFIQIDEISNEDFSKKKLDKLKNIITSKTIKYEKKGFDPIIINNFCNTIMTTNHNFSIPITQNDRRNVFFKCDDTYLGNHKYWNDLHNHLNSNEVARAFYEYLLNYDLSSIMKDINIESGLQSIRPITSYNEDLRTLCIQPIYRFYSALTRYNYNEEYDPKYCLIDNEDLYINIQASKLYTIYTEWYIKCGYNNKPISLPKFFMDLKKMEGVNKINAYDYYIYNIDKNKFKEGLIKEKLYDEDAFIC